MFSTRREQFRIVQLHRTKTVSGSSNVGGLVGWNLNDGVLTKNTSNANISASGKENAGGIAGRNNGNIIIENSRSVITRSVSAGKQQMLAVWQV